MTRSARGKTPESAAALARKVASKAVVTTIEKRACPNCGCYQPDAEAAVRVRKIEPFTFVPLLGIVVVIAAMPAQVNIWIWVAGLAVIVAGILRLVVLARFNINSNPNAARAEAGDFVNKRLLEMLTPGTNPESMSGAIPHTDLTRPRLPFILMITGTLLLVAADAGLWLSGAPLNLNCRPVIAGPGDNVKVYFPEHISAVNGLWNAHATVNLSNADELGLKNAELPAQAQHDEWGTVFSGEHLSNSEVSPWAGFTLPDTSTLSGKTVEIEAQLDMTYPQLAGSMDTFDDVEQSVTYRTPIVLSGPGAGSRQTKFSWIGVSAGAAFILVGAGILLITARRMRRNAPQPRIYAAESDLL